jgi:hypothetical protein
MNIWTCKSCVQSKCLVYAAHNRSNFKRYLTVIKTNFSVDILQWIKHGCFTTLQSPSDSQLSGLNAMNRIQSVERRYGQLARLRHQFSGMRVVLCPSITSKRARPSTASNMAVLEHLNDEIKKKPPISRRKKCCFIKTMHHITNESKQRQNCMN